MPDGTKTLGTLLKMSTEAGSPQTWITIGNVTDIQGPQRNRNIIDVSNLSSEAAAKIGGLLDEGDVTFTVNYDPTNSTHQALDTAHEANVAREFQIVLADSGAAEIHFNGIISNLSLAAPFDDKLTRSVTVAITGKIWITY